MIKVRFAVFILSALACAWPMFSQTSPYSAKVEPLYFSGQCPYYKHFTVTLTGYGTVVYDASVSYDPSWKYHAFTKLGDQYDGNGFNAPFSTSEKIYVQFDQSTSGTVIVKMKPENGAVDHIAKAPVNIRCTGIGPKNSVKTDTSKTLDTSASSNSALTYTTGPSVSPKTTVPGSSTNASAPAVLNSRSRSAFRSGGIADLMGIVLCQSAGHHFPMYVMSVTNGSQSLVGTVVDVYLDPSAKDVATPLTYIDAYGRPGLPVNNRGSLLAANIDPTVGFADPVQWQCGPTPCSALVCGHGNQATTLPQQLANNTQASVSPAPTTAQLQTEIARLQAQLATAPPAEKTKLQEQIRALQQQLTMLNSGRQQPGTGKAK
jgi:hypothetical protein